MQMTLAQRPLSLTSAGASEDFEKDPRLIQWIESSDCNLRTYMHLQVCRAELQTYFAGLLNELGYPSLLDTQHVETQLTPLNNGKFGSLAESLTSAGASEDFEKDPRLIQCYEC